MEIWPFYMTNNINDMLNETGKPNIPKLAFAFLICSFMAATQDIAADEWALIFLQKNIVDFASTRFSMGTIMGLMISVECCILLTPENFSNKYLRITPNVGGLVTVKKLTSLDQSRYVGMKTCPKSYVPCVLDKMYKSNGSNCVVTMNGFYVESVACTIIGIIWCFVFKNKLKQLQSKSSFHWLVDLKIQEPENDKNAHIINVIT